MRVWVVLGAMLVAACGSDPPPPAVAPMAPAPPASVAPAAPAAPADEKDDDIPDSVSGDEEPVPAPASPEPVAPSTASFEQATSKPEPIRRDDDHLHLTDNQLSNPMRGVLVPCKVPPSVKVTIKTAVQFGHAIGVTVSVDMPKLKQPKKPSKKWNAIQKSRAKTVQRITTCADHAVRSLSWPPSRRRDAFTTTF